MPPPRLHEIEIADKIVGLIDQNLSAEMGLKVVTIGALEYFPARENLAENVPAVFVKPWPSTDLERITTGQTYRITYNFRIVFVKLFGPNEDITKEKTIQSQKIGEMLIDNVNLGNLVLINGQILRATLKAIEWSLEEDRLAGVIHADMAAAGFVFTVETTSRL
jgi:hypothetical protein